MSKEFEQKVILDPPIKGYNPEAVYKIPEHPEYVLYTDGAVWAWVGASPVIPRVVLTPIKDGDKIINDEDGWSDWKTFSSNEDKALFDILELPKVRDASYRVNIYKNYVNFKVTGGDPTEVGNILFKTTAACVKTIGSLQVEVYSSDNCTYRVNFDYTY